MAHGRSLRWHPVSPSKAEGADLSRPAEAPTPGEIIPESWVTSSRNGGRDHLGMADGIIPERRAASLRNRQAGASFWEPLIARPVRGPRPPEFLG
jgi:hypothetical protein